MFSQRGHLNANRNMKKWSTSQICREIKIKSTMRYQVTPVRMVRNQETSASEDVEKCNSVNWFSYYTKHCRSFPQIRIRYIIQSINSISVYILLRNESRLSKRYIYSHIYCSIIHNNQHIETTQVPVSG